MSGHGVPNQVPPHPPQRSASTGPNGALQTPTSAAMVNGVTGGMPPGSSGGGQGGGAGAVTGSQMSQQNLNQIVIDYLAKKGYTKTEQMLRAESANQEVAKQLQPPQPVPRIAPKYQTAYKELSDWADDALEIYKPELQRLLWPIFVHCYLMFVRQSFQKDARQFIHTFRERFRQERQDELRKLEPILLPEHLEADNVGKTYQENKYRLTMSTAAFEQLMQFLENLKNDGSKLLISIIQNNLDIRQTDRASDDRFSFASVILRARDGQDVPMEDEGIPGHRPGNAISSTDPNVGNTLAALKLGKLQMDTETEGDVRADLADLDLQVPPPVGQPSYVQTHELINIKQEDDDEGPSRTEIPFPQSTARDVAMEVQKVRENRDRFKIETRTGGIGPGVSVCMYTFHNTKDSITCMDFSGDNQLIAAGTSESYIRVWSMDGKAITTNESNVKPQASHRLIGHSGPVYTVAFTPSTMTPPNSDVSPDTKWLLSCSADGTIRLWNLDIFQQVVVYKGHVGPVWSLSWGPMGHYFVTGGMDKTARIWSTDKPRQLRILAGHDSDVEVVAWHPNSAYVFTAGYDKTVRMWAMSNGQPVRMFTGHTSPITALACSKNGKVLASADDGGSILLWDLATGRLIKRMRGHGKGGIWSLSWSVESTVLVSGGADQTVRVWDVAGPPKAESTQKLPGEAGKVDGVGVAAGASAGTLGGGKKSKKDAVVTADQISAFLTKSTPVYRVGFTRMNLVVAGGAYLP